MQTQFFTGVPSESLIRSSGDSRRCSTAADVCAGCPGVPSPHGLTDKDTVPHQAHRYWLRRVSGYCVILAARVCRFVAELVRVWLDSPLIRGAKSSDFGYTDI